MPKELSPTRVLLALTLVKAVLTIEMCGHSQNILRIVGGNETKPLENPWMVYMKIIHVLDNTKQINHKIRCGAILIDDQWLVTAAHCFRKQTKSRLSSVHLTLGAHNVNKKESKQIELIAQKFFSHSSFNPSQVGSKHDIAMVKLPQKLDFKGKHRYLQPICLPQKGLPIKSDDCRVVGWGRTSNTKTTDSDVLKEAKVSLISSTECRKVKREVDESEVCAGHNGVGTCKGDSGGPLQCPLANGVWILEGITSYGSTVCAGRTPSVYTKVEAYIDWINSIRKTN